MIEILLNPIYLFIIVIFLTILSFYLRSKRRQRDIQKGVEKALKKLNKENNDEYWG